MSPMAHSLLPARRIPAMAARTVTEATVEYLASEVIRIVEILGGAHGQVVMTIRWMNAEILQKGIAAEARVANSTIPNWSSVVISRKENATEAAVASST